MDKQKYIVSFSGGKDSMAMLLLLLNKNAPIDDVIFFDGGWEFPEMYDHIKLVEQKTGIKITVVKPPKPFEYYLNEIVLVSGKHAGKQGYGWPWAKGRWCTRLKVDTIKQVVSNDAIQYIGIALDEQKRIVNKPNKQYPLVEMVFTEKQCLEYCYSLGYTWSGLYERHNRVSCFCCPLQRVASIKYLYFERPELWYTMKQMNQTSKQYESPSKFHGRTLAEWEARFEKERQKENENERNVNR